MTRASPTSPCIGVCQLDPTKNLCRGCGRTIAEIAAWPDLSEWWWKDEDTFASWGQKKIYWGPLNFLEKPLLRSPIVPWSYAASNIYYNLFWYPAFGRGRVKAAKQTEWGKLFDSY